MTRPLSTRPGASRRDPYEASGLVRFLTRPAAFLAANWAAMLGLLTVVGIVPALAGATRVTGDLPTHEDSAFTDAMRHVRRTLRRDAPASLGVLMALVAVVGNILVLPQLDPSIRVFAVGLTLPVMWVLVAMLSAYVRVASEDQHSDRAAIATAAIALVIRRPAAALVAPALVVLLSPLWLLAQFTIACGFSVPAWVVGRLWGPTAQAPVQARRAPHMGA